MNTRLWSSLEPLEDRIAPAGIVKVTVGAGSVKIIGDAAANSVSIALSPTVPGLLVVSGTGGTLIDFGGVQGASANITNYTKDLTVALGDGADSVTLGTGAYYGNITLDGGPQANTFAITGSTPVIIPGSLKVLAKAGPDTVTINTPGNDLKVGRDLLVNLGSGGADSTLTTSRLLVGGKLTITGGADIEDFSWNTTSDIVVGGDLTIASGKNLDRIALVAAGDVGITGKLTLTGGDSVEIFQAAISSASVGVTAADEMSVRGTVKGTTIAGDAILNIGGTNSSSYAAGVSIKTGKGQSTVNLGGTSQTYLGKLSVSAGGPTDFTMAATNFFIGSDFTFKGSTGTDLFELQGTGFIAGKLSVDLADGVAQSLSIDSPTAISVFGDVTLKQGAKTGTSATTVSGLAAFKKFTLTTGAAADTITLDNLLVRGATAVATGAGIDILQLETQGDAGTSDFSGPFKISMGAGNDQVTMGVTGNVDNRVILDVLDLIPAPGVEGVLDVGDGDDTFSGFIPRGNVGNLLVLNLEI